METPKTTEEARSYIGQYFVMDSVPNCCFYFKFLPNMKHLIGQEVKCIGTRDHAGKPTGIRIADGMHHWSLEWGWIEPVKDIEDIEDLLDHWE